MSVVTEAEEILLNLPLRERGEFAVRLLATLRPPEEDGDAIIAEAIRRSEELTRDQALAFRLPISIVACWKSSEKEETDLPFHEYSGTGGDE